VTPTISVVIPVGPSAPLLGEQLRALADQREAPPFEIVLSLNCSNEQIDAPPLPEHVTLVETHADAKPSPAYARNHGVSEASGDLLLFCDADDVVDADWVREMAGALDACPAAGGRIDEETLNPPEILRWRPPVTDDDLPLMFGARYFLTANFGIRRDVFEAVGRFDERLPINEDVAFAWRLQERGYELGFADRAIVQYRHRPGLWLMLRQHYAYGRGMTMLLRHYGLPTRVDGALALPHANLAAYFRANGQAPRSGATGSRARKVAIGGGRLRELLLPSKLRSN
jgi:glycosyltransferase involved in cell wall biosynthesis